MTDEQIRKLFKDFIKQPFQVRAATCIAYDEQQQAVDVSPLDAGADMFDVRLKAKLSQVGGIEIVPKVGSTLLVGIINNDDRQAFVLMVSEVESILLSSETPIKLQGDELGGLVVADRIREELNKTKAMVDAIAQSLLNWSPVAQDGGAALKALATSNLSGKTTGNYSDIENSKVTHG